MNKKKSTKRITNKCYIQHTKIENKQHTGPDDLKGELYEAFAQSDACTTVLKASFQDILDNNKEVPAWKKSKTKMVPKTKIPTVQKLRPIALTDVSYKLYMKIIGSKIDQHILKQQEKMTTTLDSPEVAKQRTICLRYNTVLTKVTRKGSH